MKSVELDIALSQLVEELRDDIDAYDERAAIQEESREAQMRSKTTGQFAIEALQRPERFVGEHDVAHAWLREYEAHLRIFQRVTR